MCSGIRGIISPSEVNEDGSKRENVSTLPERKISLPQMCDDTNSESQPGGKLFTVGKNSENINPDAAGNSSAFVSGSNTEVRPISKLFWNLQLGSLC